jgi:hypothetical protein
VVVPTVVILELHLQLYHVSRESGCGAVKLCL